MELIELESVKAWSSAIAIASSAGSATETSLLSFAFNSSIPVTLIIQRFPQEKASSNS